MRYLILIIFLTFTACATSNPGHLKGELQALFIPARSDMIYYRSVAQDSWVRSSLDGKNVKRIFASKYGIVDASPDGQTIVLNSKEDKIENRGSALFIYRVMGSDLREVPRPPSGYQFDEAALSPDSTQLAASAKMPYLQGIEEPPYDDTVYLIDVNTLGVKPLKKYPESGQVYHIYWTKDGKKIVNDTLQWNRASKPFQELILERTPLTNTLKIRKEYAESITMYRNDIRYFGNDLRASPILPHTQCGPYKVSAIEGSSDDQDTILRLSDSKSKIDLANIEGRYGGGDCLGPVPLNPTFTSDCNFVVFTLGDDLLMVDIKTRRVTKIGRGSDPVLFPN